MTKVSNSLRHLLVGLILLGVLIQAPLTQAQSNAQESLASCSQCHGENGNPKDSRVPVIWGQSPSYLQKQLIAYRSGQRDNQIMGSMAESVPKAQLLTLAQNLSVQTWPTKAAPNTNTTQEWILQSRLSGPKSMNVCLACHTADPSAMSEGTPRLWGQNLEYLLEQMSAYAQDDRTTSEAMSAILKTISKKDQTEIARFYASH
jgi:cytochrome c553